MKTLRISVLFVLLFALVLVPVGAQKPPIDEDALDAFGMSFSVFLVGSMITAFGQSIEGFTIEESETTAVIRFDNLSLASLEMNENFGYTHIDGTITAIQADDGSDDGDMEAEFTLSGGPISRLEWSVQAFNMNSEEEVDFTIVADGKKYVLNSTDFQAGF